MPYLFTCPHCHSKTQVDDRYSGQSGRCAVCGEPIRLPEFADRQAAGESAASPRKRTPLAWLAPAAVLLVLVVALSLVVIQAGSRAIDRLDASRVRNASMRNLEKVASALNAYAADHGRYPPPALTDSSGQKLHSWRVLILPYLEQEALYNQFDLSKPWDDPVNLPLGREIPAVYQHPHANVGATFQTSPYFLVTGIDTLFPPEGPLGPDQVTDEPSKTLLVVEGSPTSPGSSWTEPVDLDVFAMKGQINGKSDAEPGGLHDDGAALVTVDGRAHFAPSTMPPMTFQSLVTPRGGEPLPDDVLD